MEIFQLRNSNISSELLFLLFVSNSLRLILLLVSMGDFFMLRDPGLLIHEEYKSTSDKDTDDEETDEVEF